MRESKIPPWPAPVRKREHRERRFEMDQSFGASWLFRIVVAVCSIPLCQQCDYTFNIRLHFRRLAIGKLLAHPMLQNSSTALAREVCCFAGWSDFRDTSVSIQRRRKQTAPLIDGVILLLVETGLLALQAQVWVQRTGG